MNEILLNDVDRIRKLYGKRAKLISKTNLYVARNQCALGDYVAAAISPLLNSKRSVVYTDAASGREGLALEKSQEKLVMTADMKGIPTNTRAIFTVNCLDERYRDPEEQEQLRATLLECLKRFAGKNKLLVFAAVVPEPVCPGEMTALAEREYDAYLEQKEERTWQEEFYLSLERILRDKALNAAMRIIQLRFTNIIGPECDAMTPALDLETIFQDAQAGTVNVAAADRINHFSYIPVAEAAYSVLLAYSYPRKLIDRTYSISLGRASVLDFKYALYKGFSEQLVFNAEPLVPVTPVYHALNSLRFSAAVPAFKKLRVNLPELSYRLGCYKLEESYNIFRKLGVYEGRLKLIQEKEKMLLKAIDDVCRRNNIKYFLAGGSTLGAIRHNDMIPWDDDIDIGMLREEFEKFRKVLPKELEKPLLYEAANGKSKSHYHYDKVRLPNTFFSTHYSGNFKIPDGVFIDILVYDRTSNSKFWQKVHIKLTCVWTRVMNIKWVNRARKTVHYRASKIALPVMRLIPWNFFHWMFERIVRFYEKKKNAKYAIDSCGLYIKKGALQLSWMKDVKYVKFGDMEAPVPVGYDAYLRHFYGPNYMSLLPIDKRISGHKIARLDLGPVIYGEDQSCFDRKLSIRGDLLEPDGRTGMPKDGVKVPGKVYDQNALLLLRQKAKKERLKAEKKARQQMLAEQRRKAQQKQAKKKVDPISAKKAARRKKNSKLNRRKNMQK